MQYLYSKDYLSHCKKYNTETVLSYLCEEVAPYYI